MPKPSEARTIERLALDSTALKSAGYDEARKILALEFNSGSVHFYHEFPAEAFEAFGAAESLGTFFAKQIKGKYKGESMTGLCPKCIQQGYIGELCERCGGAEIRAIDRRKP